LYFSLKNILTYSLTLRWCHSYCLHVRS